MTQQQLADYLCVTKQAVSKWENNKGYPDIALIQSIASFFDLSLDALLGQGKLNRKRNWLIYLSIVFIFIVILLSSLFIHQYINKQRFVHRIEELIEFDLPRAKSYQSFDFQDWEFYGNTISINHMSYIIFINNSQLAIFENQIESDDLWTQEVATDLLTQIPMEIQHYIEQHGYYMLYNTSMQTYQSNTCAISSCHYVFLIYQSEHHRLLIFEYDL